MFTEEGLFLCPLCPAYLPMSEYLATVFDNKKALWVANMVTHYRHWHVNYYNRHVGYASYKGRYDAFKHEVNERAKRQIIRKATPFLRAHGITADDFAELQGTTEETMTLALKMLGGSPRERRPKIVVDMRRGQLTLSEWGVIL